MRAMTRTRSLAGLAGWLVLTFLAAAAGGFASANAGSFYQQLVRPSWAPPGWGFGPVWSVLYLLMGIAAWMVWREREPEESRGALILYVVQLIANALWTWLFFAWRKGALSFIEILILWLLIVATIVTFWRIRRLAGTLLLPYLAWVTFASALTLAMWRLNPGILG